MPRIPLTCHRVNLRMRRERVVDSAAKGHAAKGVHNAIAQHLDLGSQSKSQSADLSNTADSGMQTLLWLWPWPLTLNQPSRCL